MPQGKGTYGSQVGRPKKKKKAVMKAAKTAAKTAMKYGTPGIGGMAAKGVKKLIIRKKKK